MAKIFPPIKNGPKRETLLLSLLAVVVILVYADTLTTPFIFDDLVNIYDNPHIRIPTLSPENIVWAAFNSPIPSRPVANVSFALNYYFNGYNPVGYHAINILIHTACGIFLYLLVKATFQTPALRCSHEKMGWIPFLTAFIWMVHPLQVQSVTYIVQRMNSLAAMFYVLSLLFYATFRLSERSRWKWLRLAGCLVSAVLAVGTKEIAATLPLFILLYECYFFQELNAQWAKRNLFALGAGALLFITIALGFLDFEPVAKILSGYRTREFTPIQRLLTESRVVVFYISLLLWPHPSRLNLDHDFALSYSLLNPLTTLFSMTAILALVAFALLIARKEPLISFCIIWFLGNLMIESSIIGLELVFEHRNYLPGMFAVLAIVSLAFRCSKHGLPAVIALSLVGALFCGWTFARNQTWADEITLYRDSAEKSPGKARVHNNLGAALSRQKRFQEAIKHCRTALEINPQFADAHYNLGFALVRTGELDQGILHFREAVRIAPMRVKYLNNLGAALVVKGNYAEALGHFNTALTINPSDADLHNNIGLTYKKRGQFEAAQQHFYRAVSLDPRHTGAVINWGVVLMDHGQFEAAEKHFIRALEIRPGHGEALRRLNQIRKRKKAGASSEPEPPQAEN